MSATDGTGAGLVEFLDWVAQRGEINPTTARALLAASRAVLAIEDGGDKIPIESLNVDELLGRFENLRRTDYSESSMSTYLSRFRTSVAMYTAWLNKRSDWKTFGPGRKAPKSKDVSPSRAPRSQTNESRAAAESTDVEDVLAPVQETMISYEMPLRRDLRARLVLPEDLTSADAERIAAFVRSLAFDPEGSG